jgi:hypothetical protein
MTTTPLRHRIALGLLTAGALTGHALAADATAPGAKPAAQLGVYLGAECKGAKLVAGYGEWLGRKPDRALEFLANDTWEIMENASKRSPECWQQAGVPMTFSVSMLPADRKSNLKSGAAGEYNQHFRKIAENFVATGQANAIVRPGWEFNYGWYPWTAKTDPEAWIGLWRQIVTTMRSVPGQKFRFDWSPAIGQGDIAPDKAWPGDAYVDIVGLDVYNQTWQWPVPSPDKLWDGFMNQQFGLKWHRDFAAAHGKQMSFPEWGTGTRPDGHGRGDDPEFMQRMTKWIADNNVAYHVYWDYEAPDFNAKLSNGQYPKSAQVFRQAYGQR